MLGGTHTVRNHLANGRKELPLPLPLKSRGWVDTSHQEFVLSSFKNYVFAGQLWLHNFILNAWEADGYPWVWGQPSLQIKFQDKGYTEQPCLKKLQPNQKRQKKQKTFNTIFSSLFLSPLPKPPTYSYINPVLFLVSASNTNLNYSTHWNVSHH